MRANALVVGDDGHIRGVAPFPHHAVSRPAAAAEQRATRARSLRTDHLRRLLVVRIRRRQKRSQHVRLGHEDNVDDISRKRWMQTSTSALRPNSTNSRLGRTRRMMRTTDMKVGDDARA